jgi:hypothetical protein
MKMGLKLTGSLLVTAMSLMGCSPKMQNNTPTSLSTSHSSKGPVTQMSQRATVENTDPIQRYLVWDSRTMQMHLFDGADSVWIDGDWHDKNGLVGARYVATFYGTKTDPNQAIISVYENEGYQDFKCPRNIGHIAINSITDSGANKWMLLQLVSTSGVRGTFNLKTKQWTFAPGAEKTHFVNIDPIRPLTQVQPNFIGAISAWIDGDWHQSGGFGVRYVTTYPGAKGEFSYFIVTDMNRGPKGAYFPQRLPLHKTFHCPKDIGEITILNIVNNGTTVDFKSSSGVRGTWIIDTNKWNFD